jgi:penicillin-binding protein 1A
MDLILVKIFATALALSEVMTQPQDVKTHFDSAADQDQVVQTLRRLRPYAQGVRYRFDQRR